MPQPTRRPALRTLSGVLGLSLLGLCAHSAELGLPNAGGMLQELKPQPDTAPPKAWVEPGTGF